MSRPSHILSVLHLFDGGDAAWTVEAIARELGVSVRTSYRTVAELTRNGFLDPGPGATYVLGPAFIRFDRIIRQSDPLIRIASPGMLALLDGAGRPAAALLCRRFRDCVMCVHGVEAEAANPIASYERGVAMSPFRGAPAKIMLSHLPDRVLRGIYLRNEEAIRTSGIETWRQFRAMLRDVRKAGVAVTESEIGQNRMGIAAPILRGDQIVASLSLVVAPATGEALQRLSTLVTGVAASISSALAADDDGAAAAPATNGPGPADAPPAAALPGDRRRVG
ncbi:IclR family transcriptional regulator C-terminal domain-containing protein [Rhodoplanes sp. TEM]|uniref:IclR family transcriptional regulator C-terminal domain-containing protein n=1 Tax=Rhodoplanes tepidamans TaxID=200616 RepID=A0ABT5J7A5_RHOTP|nr:MULTISPECIES: IclR family transcriptional regulator C-terminal domain-containing protein [Rhodoplanes]MDC7785536.1 IclR family transcriptional regulator C-terminal domain-containing protein [Rhodoplanes tepidamans]MDC7986182.1 IclR family transcriptional regulator C-terminal domain-containing protein [Rhodoplanes sp. TEM]MDQ0353294.1 DNA-binding IclR family transcriptional regulator [Rhodoplanes tepidamans]